MYIALFYMMTPRIAKALNLSLTMSCSGSNLYRLMRLSAFSRFRSGRTYRGATRATLFLRFQRLLSAFNLLLELFRLKRSLGLAFFFFL